MLAQGQRLPVESFPTKGFSKFRSRYFLVKIAENHLASTRLAIIIGKVAAKLATERHAIKRQVLSRVSKCGARGKDVLIIAQGSLGEVGKKGLSEDIDKIITFITS